MTALLPENYVEGELGLLADGCGGDSRHLGATVRKKEKGGWVNTALAAAVEDGRIKLVQRSKGLHGRGDDDREIIRRARGEGAYVCSNDQYREHFKLRGNPPPRRMGVGEAHLFRNKTRFNEVRPLARAAASRGISSLLPAAQWARERRFGCSFTVAPGLDNKVLLSMSAAGRAAAAEAEGRAASEALHPGLLSSAPWLFTTTPVYFQPLPGNAMITAQAAIRRRAFESE